MTGLASILARAVTVAGQAGLRATDPKRRRMFGLPARRRGPLRWVARGAVWTPALGLIWIGDLAALVIWMGAATVSGWGIACLTPALLDRTKTRIAEWLPWGVLALSIAPRRPVEDIDARFAEMEARLTALEAIAKPNPDRSEFATAGS
ncbi:MAG: hypothetical protein AAFR79_10855 [Pseudomonadota bacterium]